VDARDRVPHFGSLLLQVFLLLKVRFSSSESGEYPHTATLTTCCEFPFDGECLYFILSVLHW
jgi:hypothetical protein